MEEDEEVAGELKIYPGQHLGTVDWFDENKRYGFIRYDDDCKVLVHFSQISGPGPKTLSPGDRVLFEIEEGPRGPQAVYVMPIKKTA